MNYIIVGVRAMLANYPPVRAWQLERVVQIAVSNTSVNLVRPHFIDRMPELTQSAYRLQFSTGRPGIRISPHIGYEKNSQLDRFPLLRSNKLSDSVK